MSSGPACPNPSNSDVLNPVEEFAPATAEELARFVAENAAGPRRPIVPVGGRTALHYGGPTAADAVFVSLCGLQRVVDYPARDMTITVESGVRLEQLDAVVAAERQRLPVDIPQAHRASIGGAIATNTSGPGRYAHGTLRDYVIGATAVDGRGRIFSAGGRVVKNVAGYDLCKLLVGSLGTLGIITQVTLKLRPRPAERRVVWALSDDLAPLEAMMSRLLTSAARPVAIEVLNPKGARQIQAEARQDLPVEGFVVAVFSEGTPAETEWQSRVLTEELASSRPGSAQALAPEPSQAIWSAMAEYQTASDDPLTFQAVVPPSRVVGLLSRATEMNAAVQTHAGNGVLIGHLPDSCTSAERAAGMIEPLRDYAESQGGALVVLSCEDAWKSMVSVFGKRRPEDRLMAEVKRTLDPYGLLNPGRFPPAEKD
jgi:glycolate oxidase FAD binding subunit